MQKKNPGDLFWLLLGVFNVLAASFPLKLCLEAEDDLERLLAILAVIGVGLLVTIVDAVSIVIAYSK